jgi:hypothetical protein
MVPDVPGLRVGLAVGSEAGLHEADEQGLVFRIPPLHAIKAGQSEPMEHRSRMTVSKKLP